MSVAVGKVELLCGPDMERYEEGVQLADQVIALEPKNRAYYLKGFGLLRVSYNKMVLMGKEVNSGGRDDCDGKHIVMINCS